MELHTAFDLSLTHFLSAASIAGAAFVIAWKLALLLSKKENKFFAFVSRNVLPIGFLVSFGGMVMSLVYSEVFHYAPCDLCWFQRIFLFPTAFLFAYAWWKKDRNILAYALVLSIAGFLIAGYHHLLQMGYSVYKPCSTAPFAVDCSTPSFIEFGFVTFPFWALVLFGLLSIIIMTAVRFKK